MRRGYVVISIDAFMFGERRVLLDADQPLGWDRSRYTPEQFQKLKLIEFTPETPIDHGALVQIEMRGGTTWYFVAPKAGGLEADIRDGPGSR